MGIDSSHAQNMGYWGMQSQGVRIGTPQKKHTKKTPHMLAEIVDEMPEMWDCHSRCKRCGRLWDEE